jgi:putative endonuclease
MKVSFSIPQNFALIKYFFIFLMNNKQLGKYGEDIACDFLKLKGYNIVDRNVLYKEGEIDILAQEKISFSEYQLVFVEVKTRSQTMFGSPLDAINHSKLLRMYRAAYQYLKAHPSQSFRSYRFDVIGILAPAKEKPCIRHEKNIQIFPQ